MPTSNDLVDIDIQSEDDDAVVIRVDGLTTSFPFRVYSSETEGNLMTVDPDGSIGAPAGRFPQLTTDYITYSSVTQGPTSGTVQASTAARDVHISLTGNTTLELSETSVPTNAEHQITIKNTHGSNTITITLNDALWIKPASANVFTLGPGAWYSFRIKRIEGTWVVQTGTTSTGISLIVTGLVWKGAYSGATSYSLNDVVSYNGSSYVNILQSVGNDPTNTTYFSLLAGQGDDGAAGTNGRNPGFRFTLLTTTSSGDPGSGKLKFNAASSSATILRINYQDADSGVCGEWIKNWADSTSTIKGTVILTEAGDPSVYGIFEVTAVSDQTTYANVTIVPVSAMDGTSNNTPVNVTFYRTGDAA